MRLSPVFALAAAAAGASAQQDLLLIPDSQSDRVWAFSAADGALVSNAFLTDPGTVGGVDVFNRPIEVLVSATGTYLVTDQFADVVSEFGADRSFIRVFSLGGVRDTQIMDNMRGGHVLTQGPGAGDVLVCNAGGTNALLVSQNNVKRLDSATGAELTDFAFNRYGGLRGPFDAIEYNGKVLIADEGQRAIVRYTLDGKFDERFTSDFDVPQIDFPQQMAIAGNGNLLLCEFSSGVILEFAPDATLVGQYSPGTLSLFRGIAELDNGNLLVTTTTGVYEVTRAGLVVQTEATGTDFRYITRVTPSGALRLGPPPEIDRTPVTESRSVAQAVADERARPEDRKEDDR
mgnify:CR=1 FL=1|tara:strand:+ start:31368 stop:32405 length:1038 start_codon:yes stop_codon:yes gene_type:complete